MHINCDKIMHTHKDFVVSNTYLFICFNVRVIVFVGEINKVILVWAFSKFSEGGP